MNSRLLIPMLFAALIATASAQQVIQTQHHAVRVTPLIKGLDHPWALAFLPDGRMLVTERRGS
jgi:glucose/arabinose dehydrogenase